MAGPWPHIEVMQYGPPTTVNSMDALPGEVVPPPVPPVLVPLLPPVAALPPVPGTPPVPLPPAPTEPPVPVAPVPVALPPHPNTTNAATVLTPEWIALITTGVRGVGDRGKLVRKMSAGHESPRAVSGRLLPRCPDAGTTGGSSSFMGCLPRACWKRRRTRYPRACCRSARRPRRTCPSPKPAGCRR
jgi:hypothetical protein